MPRPTRLTLHAGVGLVVAGLALFVFTWGRVAGLTSVPLQLPYIVSGGLTGLALVLVGLTLVNVHVKLTESEARARQLDRLTDLVVELGEDLGSGQGPDGSSFRRPADAAPADADEGAA